MTLDLSGNHCTQKRRAAVGQSSVDAASSRLDWPRSTGVASRNLQRLPSAPFLLGIPENLCEWQRLQPWPNTCSKTQEEPRLSHRLETSVTRWCEQSCQGNAWQFRIAEPRRGDLCYFHSLLHGLQSSGLCLPPLAVLFAQPGSVLAPENPTERDAGQHRRGESHCNAPVDHTCLIGTVGRLDQGNQRGKYHVSY